MTPKRDDFDGPQGPDIWAALSRVRPPALSPKWAVGSAVLLFIALGIVVVASYPRHNVVTTLGQVPLVRADATPYRVKPQDPGGMEIPYRDSTVFNALHAGNEAEGDGKVENLLAPPEQPLPRAQIFPVQKADDKPPSAGLLAAPPPTAKAAELPDTNGDLPPPAPVLAKIEPSVEKPVADQPPAAPQPPKPETENPETTKPEVAKPAPAADDADVKPDATSPVKATGNTYIQLGAVRSADDARAVWAKKKTDDPDDLGGLTLHVEEANLPKGTYYRVQAGPLATDKAKALCAALNAKKAGSCLVAHH